MLAPCLLYGLEGNGRGGGVDEWGGGSDERRLRELGMRMGLVSGVAGRTAGAAQCYAAGMTRPPDRKLLGYLAGYDPHIARLALALRDVVLEEAPEAIESIVKSYAVAIGFSFTAKPMKDGFCHVVAYAGKVNLGFNRGALMPDPNHVLEGTGKMMRHVTIHTLEDLERPWLRRYLRTAMEMVSRAEQKKRV